ncbi:pilus assembly protein [Nocardioides marmorisolisilvae]|uniref:Pilus assembly protein n=2 Tax=Nocardioides marmorisolisilvae TaxID=1542737 RepID=A0A3N0DY98_9ACTN|nr:pilus assembly protein [Nocardioides marmorisolisilvae]
MGAQHHALRGRRARTSEGGAAAVEFALVSTVLFIFLFGIVQYGLYFNDSLNARQGVREAARQGVVQMPASSYGSCGSAGVTWAKLKCFTKAQVGGITGSTYVHLVVPDTGGWKKGNRLIVCAAVKSDGLVGILPMPNGGVIRGIGELSIEQDSAPPTDVLATANSDSDPSGLGWSWCA